ncbi:MAG: DUF1957 domain-containing protein [Spirochaetaceae bacterium]|nr:DUF1957 domain-containing protein [Spirochaetaceae bacterium]
MNEIVDRYSEIPEDKLLHRALNQLARENLLLQSSDWPFLITTWQAKDYATDRFNEHVERFAKIADMIDSGNIAIILFHTGGLSQSQINPEKSLFGKYYNDDVGHYIIIKGYSLNEDFFVAYDPIPNDWTVNSFRYGDGISMVGRNRYYSTAEILRSLRRHEMMVIPRMANQ